ncbi:MAG TPA: hypothetical protein VIN35_07620 [Hydrogenophaga sp.]
MNAALVASMAGCLRVAPGLPLPHSLASSRVDWAQRLSAGQPCKALPGLMASLFSLCGNAHRLCAQLAVDAARGEPGVLRHDEVAQRLRLEAAQEHVRRIGLDWPRLVADGSPAVAQPAVADLAACPALHHTGPPDWPAMAAWLQACWLRMPPAEWLSGWLAGADDWLRQWSQTQVGWLPRLLAQARPFDAGGPALAQERALRVHESDTALRQLSDTLSLEPGFSQQPLWQGLAAHTGTWARLYQFGQPALSPWTMLGSRLAELARLCLDDGAADHGAQCLRWGALQAQPGVGLAWVEMARGLLVHRVTLDAGGESVRCCRVVAPTEWNFHPRGEVAQRLSALDVHAPEVARQVGLLMAAFDPCVPYELVAGATQEVAHA